MSENYLGPTKPTCYRPTGLPGLLILQYYWYCNIFSVLIGLTHIAIHLFVNIAYRTVLQFLFVHNLAVLNSCTCWTDSHIIAHFCHDFIGLFRTIQNDGISSSCEVVI